MQNIDFRGQDLEMFNCRTNTATTETLKFILSGNSAQPFTQNSLAYEVT